MQINMFDSNRSNIRLITHLFSELKRLYIELYIYKQENGLIVSTCQRKYSANCQYL